MNVNCKYVTLLVSLFCIACQPNNDWEDLFNGKDFTGFKQLNGKAPYRVENGCIVGKSVLHEKNSFMATEQEYGDFILEFEVKCDPLLNSGVQFRSISSPDIKEGRVHGYQCEIDPSDRSWSGGIYDEARRGWLVTLTNNKEGSVAFKKNDWNKYRIEAIGTSIRTWVNGVNTANLIDDETAKGIIAFQVHGIGTNESKVGKEIWWRNIRIKTKNLDKERLKGKLCPVVNRIPNVLSEEEKAEGWEILFDGKNIKGWRGVGQKSFPNKCWKVSDNALTTIITEFEEETVDLITEDTYESFELSFEFKLTPASTTGVQYLAWESVKNKGLVIGPEYQISDDSKYLDAKLFTKHPNSRTMSSLYDLIAASRNRFAGVYLWNKSVIKVFPDKRVEHWLNERKVVEYKLGSDKLLKLVKDSEFNKDKYNEFGQFGTVNKGHILLQHQNNSVSYRSIKIRKLL